MISQIIFTQSNLQAGLHKPQAWAPFAPQDNCEKDFDFCESLDCIKPQPLCKQILNQ